MSEEVEIKFNLSATYWENRFPGARVYVNENLVFENLITEPTEIHWTGNLPEGDHKIVVEMYNKNAGDTVTDDNENILNDVLLHINNISIDDIDLDQLIWTSSEYYPVGAGAPEKMLDCVDLGWNGFWQLSLSTPIYLWFLENL